MISYRSLAIASLSIAAFATPALAQESASDETKEANADDSIVVVGTLIRGAEVTGSQTLSVSTETIAAKGAVSTNELLSVVPQISNAFNGRFEVDPRGVGTGVSINRPNLRNLPGANSASGGTALVLVDGFRMAPLGVNQSSVDVDVIPTAALAGMDIVTDGGSSLYGADAVSGVINFRTMRKFDGIKADFNYGKGDTISGYSYYDAALTVGHSWSTGNVWISGAYSHRDAVLNGETSWYDPKIYNASGVGSFTGTQCVTPQQTVSRWYNFGAGFTNNPAAPGAGSFSLGAGCDAISEATYSPEVKRYNVYGALTQEFGENLSLRVTAYWAKRDTILPIVPRGFTSAGSGITGTASLLAAYPAAAATPPGSTFQVPEGVGFRFSPNSAYVNVPNSIGFETWGVTPELTYKLGTDWQIKATAHYGQSDNFQQFPNTNNTLAQCYITGCTAATSPTGAAIAAGQLNPLNVAAANGSVITAITDWAAQQQTQQRMFVGRVVADGPLFELPGGAAKIAVGLEYQYNQAKSHLTTGTFGSVSAVPYKSYSRNAKSAFGELSLPVMPFLDISASLRYDHYSDFGSTTNPSLGAALKPTNWLKIYGHWSKSFNAPTAVDGLGIATGRFAFGVYTPGSSDPTKRPSDPAPVDDVLKLGNVAMVLDGTNPGTKPQTSKSWALGFEVTPNSSLKFGGQFYSIDFKNILAAVNPQNITTYTTNPELYYYNTGTSAGLARIGTSSFDATYKYLLAQLTNGAQLATQVNSADIAIIVDRRTSNIGSAQIEGIDFNLDWQHEYGSTLVQAGISGNKQTKALTNFGTLVNELANQPSVTAAVYAAVKTGGFSSRVTVNYTGKSKDPNENNAGTIGTVVNPFTTVNLALGYDFGEGSGALNGTTIRLGVDNLFEEKPQVILRKSGSFVPFANWTIGRVLKIGLSKKF